MRAAVSGRMSKLPRPVNLSAKFVTESCLLTVVERDRVVEIRRGEGGDTQLSFIATTRASHEFGVPYGLNGPRIEFSVSLQGNLDPFRVNTGVSKRAGIADQTFPRGGGQLLTLGSR